MTIVSDEAKAKKREYDKVWRAKNRDKCKVYNLNDKRSARAREKTPQENMLRDFLMAKTEREKREVIKNFAPYYFIFGEKLQANMDMYKTYTEQSNPLDSDSHEGEI